jgi:hypothetical protein
MNGDDSFWMDEPSPFADVERAFEHARLAADAVMLAAERELEARAE